MRWSRGCEGSNCLFDGQRIRMPRLYLRNDIYYTYPFPSVFFCSYRPIQQYELSNDQPILYDFSRDGWMDRSFPFCSRAIPATYISFLLTPLISTDTYGLFFCSIRIFPSECLAVDDGRRDTRRTVHVYLTFNESLLCVCLCVSILPSLLPKEGRIFLERASERAWLCVRLCIAFVRGWMNGFSKYARMMGDGMRGLMGYPDAGDCLISFFLLFLFPWF